MTPIAQAAAIAAMPAGHEAYCSFGGSDDQTWIEGEVTHFTAATRCHPAPQTGVRHGQVTGHAIVFEPCFRPRLWYRAHQIPDTAKGNALPTAAG